MSKGKIEQQEYDERDAFTTQDVPGPRPKDCHERHVLRLGAEIHEVCFEDVIECADEGGIDVQGKQSPADRSWPRPRQTGPNKIENGNHNKTMNDKKMRLQEEG